MRAVGEGAGGRWQGQPVRFRCETMLPLAPAEVAGLILDLDQWTSFRGYGPLPGIRSAEFLVRPPGVTGTRIHVANTDGSRHVEEIVEWEPDRRIRLVMSGFSPPLSRLASRIEETWEFSLLAGGTQVVRSFAMVPYSALTRPAVWIISQLLRRAVLRHLREMGR